MSGHEFSLDELGAFTGENGVIWIRSDSCVVFSFSLFT